MFGYIIPNKPELLVREYEEYKAVYCTLCRELGKRYNIFTRLALSYDLTFYTMLALDISGADRKVRKGRCVVNPLKRCNYVCQGTEAYHKGAALTVLMTYHKIRDNIRDEVFFKVVAARMALPFIAGAAKKARRDFPVLAEAVEEMMVSQQELEKEDNPGIDACCEPTARALSKIFQELAGRDDKKAVILSQIGYFLGRWVYTIDAADDLKDDMKKGSFNPLIKRLGLSGSSVAPEEQARVDRECNEILNVNVSMLVSAENLMDFKNYGSIIDNVIHKGLPGVQREILFLHIRDKKLKERV